MAELICRYAVVEKLYSWSASEAAVELKRALVKLYTSILIYLSKMKHYLEMGSASWCVSSQVWDVDQQDQTERIIQSGLLAEVEFDTFLKVSRKMVTA